MLTIRGGRKRRRDGAVVTMSSVENDSEHYLLGQAKVHSQVDAVCPPAQKARESMAMGSKEEDLGVRLDMVLASHGLNRTRLAKKAKVSPSTCQKWKDSLTRGDITASSWHSCARALIAAGIDPNEVRPGAPTPTKSRMAELLPLLMEVSDPATLSLMLELLTVESDDDREALAVYLRTALRKL